MTPNPSVITISQPTYVRERTEPDPGDFDYLHLSDLRDGLRLVLPARTGQVLDYGCGGSPYRDLFACERYHRADFPGSTGLDFILDSGATVAAADGSYDLVLSTQVLEHVPNPERYLTEARRLLRRGGRLILSTHGTYLDHACPNDYWRWTADGLRLALENAGFDVKTLHKLTTGPRALLYLNRQFQPSLVFRYRSLPALGLRLSRLLFTRMSRQRLHRLSDREHPEYRIVPADRPWHPLYIALLATAEVA